MSDFYLIKLFHQSLHSAFIVTISILSKKNVGRLS